MEQLARLIWGLAGVRVVRRGYEEEDLLGKAGEDCLNGLSGVRRKAERDGGRAGGGRGQGR